jgi:hypothetical protein
MREKGKKTRKKGNRIYLSLNLFDGVVNNDENIAIKI